MMPPNHTAAADADSQSKDAYIDSLLQQLHKTREECRQTHEELELYKKKEKKPSSSKQQLRSSLASITEDHDASIPPGHQQMHRHSTLDQVISERVPTGSNASFKDYFRASKALRARRNASYEEELEPYVAQIKTPWYSPPVQRLRWGDEQTEPPENWMDLFFDLFYVAAVHNLTESLWSMVTSGLWLRGGIYFFWYVWSSVYTMAISNILSGPLCNK